MIHINFKLTLLALLPMPLLVYSTKKLSRQLHHRFDTAQSQFSLLTEFARNAIVSIRLVKAYTMEQQQVTQFCKLGASYMQTNLKVAVIQGLLLPAANLVGNAGLLIILFYGGYLTIIQSISIGDFAAFVTYLQMLIWPLMAVGWVTNITQRGLTSLRRIHLLLNAVSKLPPPHKNLQTETRKTADAILCTTVTQPTVFSFRNLDFFYPGSKKPSLSNISFDTDKKIIGISGRTGSGKSTLCKVLTRMYAIDDKKMFLNGYDVNTLDIFSVRSHIAYVSQEPILFSNTLAANIRIGNQHATEKEIIHAATAASFHEDILLFPKQYETLIGEKGITLSGGQRQRLAIARALISNRPLLLLDDVFSTVDVETEQKIISGILNYLKETTVIFVSNRQKLLALTNEVLFLENGLLVDKGSHETLIKRCNLYQSMVKRLFYQQTPAEKQEQDA
jgi:ATP-binding cassette subfamily B protein